MKTIKHFVLSVALLATALTSCEKDDNTEEKKEYSKVAYIVNFGGYGKGNGEINTYDIEKKEISNDSYKNANDVPFTSNIQSMFIHEDVAYLMSNAGDKIDILDASTLESLGNPVSNNITKPRYMVAKENTAYISCWGDVTDWDVYANSYIAKMDLTTKAITKLPLAGGPEGMIIKDNNLYISSSTTNKVTVMDLSTEKFTTIDVSAIPQQFALDANNKLWVSVVTKYSVPFTADKLGIQSINTTTAIAEDFINYVGMGSNGNISTSNDKNTVYALGAGSFYQDADKNWIQDTEVKSIDIVSKQVGNTIASGLAYTGFGVNPKNDNIYILSNNEKGLSIYDSKGTLLEGQEYEVGTSPYQVVFYDIEK